jgi:hypothetical protein
MQSPPVDVEPARPPLFLKVNHRVAVTKAEHVTDELLTTSSRRARGTDGKQIIKHEVDAAECRTIAVKRARSVGTAGVRSGRQRTCKLEPDSAECCTVSVNRGRHAVPASVGLEVKLEHSGSDCNCEGASDGVSEMGNAVGVRTTSVSESSADTPARLELDMCEEIYARLKDRRDLDDTHRVSENQMRRLKQHPGVKAAELGGGLLDRADLGARSAEAQRCWMLEDDIADIEKALDNLDQYLQGLCCRER